MAGGNYTTTFSANAAPFKKVLGDMQTELKKFSSGVVQAFEVKAIVNFAKKAVTEFGRVNKELEIASYTANASTQEIQSLANVTGYWGGSVSSVTSTLKSLQSAQESARFGGGPLLDLAKQYGFHFQNANGTIASSTAILRQLSGVLKNAGRGEAMNIAQKLGLDNSMIMALKNGTAAFDELMTKAGKYGVYSEEDKARADKFNQSMYNLDLIWKEISKTVVQAVLPPVQFFIDIFSEFLEFLVEHKNVIQKIVVALAMVAAVQAISMMLKNWRLLSFVIKALLPSVKMFKFEMVATEFAANGIKGALKGVAGSLLGLVSIPALIAIAFLAIVLAIEDIYTSLTGGQGVLMEWYNAVTKVKGSFAGIMGMMRYIGALLIESIVGPIKFAMKFFQEMQSGKNVFQAAKVAWDAGSSMDKMGEMREKYRKENGMDEPVLPPPPVEKIPVIKSPAAAGKDSATGNGAANITTIINTNSDNPEYLAGRVGEATEASIKQATVQVSG